MSVDFEENNYAPQMGVSNDGTDRSVGKITKLFMAIGLGRNPDIAQYFVLFVAIIFFGLAIFIYFF